MTQMDTEIKRKHPVLRKYWWIAPAAALLVAIGVCAVAVQIGRNIPPRGFGQNLQPAEPLVQTIKRQFRQIFDRPLARPVGYECSDKKAFFLVCMSTQTSMTKKL